LAFLESRSVKLQIETAATALKDAQRFRIVGNCAVKAGHFETALQAYTDALNAAGLCASMAGLLYSNRAAAYQGLGQLSLALADCCRAKALAPQYAKVSVVKAGFDCHDWKRSKAIFN
jgi:tetratricopeptide (TPR) repeat protein